jgi:hypothetical protein
MHLITMAHLGEAQASIEQLKLRRVGPRLFESELCTLLLTGEGPLEAAIAVAAELGRKAYHSVINLGVAGAMAPELAVGSLHQIRTLYLINDGKPQFKSIPVAGQGLDCLTSFERILDPQKATPLRGMAPLVDREAWGVGMAARQQNTPFICYKLVSDQAGSLGACQLVKANAEHFSELLAAKLKELLGQPRPEKENLRIEGLHLTFSMQARLQDLLSKLAIRDEIDQAAVLERVGLERIQALELLPKERAKLLIQQLEQEFDPVKKMVEQKLQAWKSSFSTNGIELSHDPSLESEEISIRFQVRNDEELRKKLTALDSLSTAPFQQILTGNFHVE